MILMREGMKFSQTLMTSSSELITRRLGNEGYTFATVEGYPELNKEESTTKVTFELIPGMRAYVRRIEFRGNTKTQDDVLRREMRQMEGASANNSLIDLSRVRLERLGYFKGVEVETIPVPEVNDQIDVIYTVEEQPSGSVGASIGYAQGYGMVLGVNLSENNFLGTGKNVAVAINRSTYQETLNLSYSEPYFTVDGVNVGYSLFSRETDYTKIGISNYSTNSKGANINWGYPLSELERIGFGLGYEMDLSWSKSTLNRGIFATRGASQRFALNLTLPGSDLKYLKATYKGQYLTGITRSLTLKLRTDLGLGKGYGETDQLPFFKNYYGGGFGSVRGFERNSLGPQEGFNSSQLSSRSGSLGGNVQIEFGAEIIFPMPFVKDKRSMQSAFFIDAGNIFSTQCKSLPNDVKNCFQPSLGELRYSIGLGVTWLSAMGPLTFSFAKPFNATVDDELEMFQFSLGNQF
jgi:outer membrane protein insertion porin family